MEVPNIRVLDDFSRVLFAGCNKASKSNLRESLEPIPVHLFPRISKDPYTQIILTEKGISSYAHFMIQQSATCAHDDFDSKHTQISVHRKNSYMAFHPYEFVNV